MELLGPFGPSQLFGSIYPQVMIRYWHDSNLPTVVSLKNFSFFFSFLEWEYDFLPLFIYLQPVYLAISIFFFFFLYILLTRVLSDMSSVSHIYKSR